MGREYILDQKNRVCGGLRYSDFGARRKQKSVWLKPGGAGGACEVGQERVSQALLRSGSFILSVKLSKEFSAGRGRDPNCRLERSLAAVRTLG